MKKLQKSDFSVGQEVYLLRDKRHYGYQAAETDIKTGVVKAIGRKYISVDYLGEIKFDITENFRESSIYGSNWHLYLSKEDILEHLETLKLRQAILDEVTQVTWRMSLEDLNTIKNILDKYLKKENDE